MDPMASCQVVPLLGDAIAQLRHDDLIDESFANTWLDTFLCLGRKMGLTLVFDERCRGLHGVMPSSHHFLGIFRHFSPTAPRLARISTEMLTLHFIEMQDSTGQPWEGLGVWPLAPGDMRRSYPHSERT